jgi:hypothetical protein
LAEDCPNEFYGYSRPPSARGGGFLCIPRGKRTLLGDDPQAVIPSLDSPDRAILLVAAGSGRDTVWTKPDGWKYDPDHPTQGLTPYVGERFFPEPGFIVICADGWARFLAEEVPMNTARALFSPRDFPNHFTTVPWHEVIFQGPSSTAVWLPLALHTLMIAWALVIVSRYWRGRPVASGENLILVIGAQQLAFLICFVAFCLSPTNALFTVFTYENHPELWSYSRMAGIAACIAVCLAHKKTLLPKAPFVFLAIGLGLAQLLVHRAGSPREALVTVPPPYWTAIACLWLAFSAPLTHYDLPSARNRHRIHWAALAGSLLPTTLFLYWSFLGYTETRFWLWPIQYLE